MLLAFIAFSVQPVRPRKAALKPWLKLSRLVSVLQAWQTPEHRAWTPVEWAAQPPPADDEEGKHDTAMPASAAAVAVAVETSAAAAITDTVVGMESSAAAAEMTNAAVAVSSSADATMAVLAEAAVQASSAGAAPAPAAAEGVRAETAEQPIDAAADADPATNVAISDAATCDQLAAEAVVAEVSANEAATASDPPAAQVAKAALASKALTVKERLAACVATERHRITFGKVKACAEDDIWTLTNCPVSLSTRTGMDTRHHVLHRFAACCLANRFNPALQELQELRVIYSGAATDADAFPLVLRSRASTGGACLPRWTWRRTRWWPNTAACACGGRWPTGARSGTGARARTATCSPSATTASSTPPCAAPSAASPCAQGSRLLVLS